MKSTLVTRISYAAGLLAGMALAALPAVAQKPYHVRDKWKVGGEGGWDYLTADSAAHRLYITHGGRVEVLDSATGKSLGAITGLKGTHGVALDEAGKYGYISDGGPTRWWYSIAIVFRQWRPYLQAPILTESLSSR